MIVTTDENGQHTLFIYQPGGTKKILATGTHEDIRAEIVRQIGAEAARTYIPMYVTPTFVHPPSETNKGFAVVTNNRRISLWRTDGKVPRKCLAFGSRPAVEASLRLHTAAHPNDRVIYIGVDQAINPAPRLPRMGIKRMSIDRQPAPPYPDRPFKEVWRIVRVDWQRFPNRYSLVRQRIYDDVQIGEYGHPRIQTHDMAEGALAAIEAVRLLLVPMDCPPWEDPSAWQMK